MKHTIAAMIFLVGIPWLLYRATMLWVIPYFGITQHASLCAVGLTCIFDAVSIVIGIWCAKGCWLPDN